MKISSMPVLDKSNIIKLNQSLDSDVAKIFAKYQRKPKDLHGIPALIKNPTMETFNKPSIVKNILQRSKKVALKNAHQGNSDISEVLNPGLPNRGAINTVNFDLHGSNGLDAMDSQR